MSRRSPTWSILLAAVAWTVLAPALAATAAGAQPPRFAAARAYAVPAVPVAVDVVDLSGDGLPDVASASQGAVISILRNRGQRSFAPPVEVSTGADGELLGDDVVADLNADGFPDIAAVSFNVGRSQAGTVSVLINNHGQGFNLPVLYPQDQEPSSIAAADVDGDGDADLAVVLFDLQTGKHEIGIMANGGDGTFGAPVIYPADRSNGPLELIDVNGDGSGDLVVIDQNASVLGILLGDGHGAFGTEATYPAGLIAVSLAVGDMNNDGMPDAVIGGLSGGSLLTNQGGGTFGPATPLNLGVGDGQAYVAVADLQGDGNLDIAAASSGGWVSPLLGRGDGTFRRGKRFAAGLGAGIAAGDLDGDGRPDLAVISQSGTVATLFGANGGRFLAAPVLLLTPGSLDAGALAATDLNGDSLPDLIMGGSTGEAGPAGGTPLSEPSLFVSLNQGGARFGPSVSYLVAHDPTGVAIADFDNDGVVDLAVSLGWNGAQNVAVLIGTGDGSFGQPSLISVPNFPADIVTGDFNGDGVLDIGLAIFNSGMSTTEVTVLPGAGDGTFGSPVTTTIGPDDPLGISADRLDGDATLDVTLFVHNIQGTDQASIVAALGTGSGTFSNVHKYPVGTGEGELATGDLDGDGVADVVASVPDNDVVPSLLGVGDGTFAPGPALSVGNGPHWLALADFTRDGTLDLVVADEFGLIWSMRGAGDATFGKPLTYAYSVGPMAAGDLDANGTLDVAQAQRYDLTISLYLGLTH